MSLPTIERPGRTLLRARTAVLLTLGVIVVAGLAYALTRPSDTAPRRTQPGGVPLIPLARRTAAPPLHGRPLQGASAAFRLGHGRVVVVNFWASWCLPCRREAPQLRRYSTAQRGRAPLVGIAINDTASAARRFMRRYRWRFPVLLDASGKLVAPYRIPGIPTTVVVDRRARIAAILIGPQTAASLRRAAAAVRGDW